MLQDPVPVPSEFPKLAAGARAPATPAASSTPRGRGRGRGQARGRGRMSLSQPPPVLPRLDEEDEDDFVARLPTKVLLSCTYG